MNEIRAKQNQKKLPPNRIGGNFSAAGKRKVFRCSSFSKMLPRCGRAAHICEANSILQTVFPAAIAYFETVKFKQSRIMRIKVANSSKATGQLQHAGRQKQGWNPLLPDVADRFLWERLFLGKPITCGSAESLRCLPRLQFAGVAFSELLMNLS